MKSRFDTSAGNPVKEILLKLNYCLRLLALDPLTEFKVTPTKHRRMTNPYSSPRFIANYLNARYLKMEVKRRSVKVKELQERCIIKAFKLTNPEKYEHKKMPTTRQGMGSTEIEELIPQSVADAMTAYEANMNYENGVHHETSASAGGVDPTPHGCSFKDFLNCKPSNFNRTERVVGLTRWFEKIESVFHISNYAENCQVKYASCTLLNGALTWWNSYVQAVGIDASY
ncbi:hypothetical protein Tco_0787702 [Tanacetum coccineum]